jgi:hypothetical protein
MSFHMKNVLFTAVVAAILHPAQMPQAVAGESSSTEPQTDKAVAAVQAYGKALKGELVAAMERGGPLAAIEVCHTEAPAIAKRVSADQGLTVTRVSLKNRNPGAAPNEWQKEVLLSFEKRAGSGEDPASLAWHATAETADGEEFRFMKAIPTDGVCLACHGETLAPEVKAKLDELYPDDKATGYAMGDIRGAFVVTQKAD